MSSFKYIASCNFTLFYPEWSARIQHYLRDKLEIIRCCTEKYRVKDFEDKMASSVAELWKNTPHYTAFDSDTCMVSICHNCTQGVALVGRKHFHLCELLFRDI